MIQEIHSCSQSKCETGDTYRNVNHSRVKEVRMEGSVTCERIDGKEIA